MQASFFKNCAKEIIGSLEKLFNKSLSEGIIPDALKKAAILPVFKSGDISLPANYRPMSLTPVLMEIFERIARKQIISFLSLHNIFNTTQHGFSEGRSMFMMILCHLCLKDRNVLTWFILILPKRSIRLTVASYCIN